MTTVAPRVIRTVDGDLSPDGLGPVLPHEHVICDSSIWYNADSALAHPDYADAEPELGILWWMRQYPNSNKSVLRLTDQQLAAKELAVFRDHGGGLVADLTTVGLGRDVEALRSVSRACGIGIVAGTGFYVAAAHPAWVRHSSIDALAGFMAREITEGVDGTGIRCGVIGEIGVSHPIQLEEERVLRAAARAQRLTGAAISVHTAAHAPGADSALEVADILQAEGADLSRVVMGHMDAMLHRPGYLRRTLARGVMVEFDLFGHEFFESENAFQSFGDTEKCRAVAALAADGYASQLLLSHDVCYLIQLESYGGYGYSHLLRNILPRLRLLGVTEGDLELMTVHNPCGILSFPA